MDANRVLTQLLGSNAAGGFAGGLAGGLASGMLTSKAGRKLGKKALKVGGIAAVGGLAYAAWSRYQAQQRDATHAAAPAGQTPAVPAGLAAGTPAPVAVPPARVEAFLPPSASRESEDRALALVRAMIAAAQADGKLDGDESRAIFERIGTLGLSAADKAELLDALSRPADLEALVRAATTPEVAAEIYAASLLAIDVDTPAERAYLQMLAARLALPDALVAALHAESGAEPGPDAGRGAAASARAVA